MAIRPKALVKGDTVGIVTLGSPLARETIDAAIAYLRQMGLNVIVGQHAYDADGYLAGTDEERAGDLTAMFADERVRLILPSRGGVGVEGILPYLDFEFIRRHPKIVSGYSDITVLLNALAQLADLVTLHSLLLIDFKPETPAYNFEQFFAATSSLVVPRPIANPPGMPIQPLVPGVVSGSLAGGNLTSLTGSLGTPYEIDTRGKILLLEETHEPVNTVYRYVEQLKLAGKLDACAGIVMGGCHECPDAYGRTYADLVRDVLVPLGKPLIAGFASGHDLYKAAVPIGAQARLDAGAGMLTLLEPAISV